jgi:formylglycine-generating enzyme required for sulfatase activity
MTATNPRHLLKWPDQGVEMAFRLIPAGEFRMGSRGYDPNEEPIHTVRIPEPFWMAETPVTQAQFALWTVAENVEHENHFKGDPNHPAENMAWYQAIQYCKWLTRTKHLGLPVGYNWACLPTEAEWEYSCRAGTETEYHSGDGTAALRNVGWYEEKSDSGSTHPVAQKAPNRFGLFDTHGNVWEWCYDLYDYYVYRDRSDGDIDCGEELRRTEWQSVTEKLHKWSRYRVLRGGSWCFSAGRCRSACRFGNAPGGEYSGAGFRVCLVRGPVLLADSLEVLTEKAPGLVNGGRAMKPESDRPNASGVVDNSGDL